ncbi:MAG: hypothetical protein LBD23_18165 [Oscillospiraceae bacterium]|jgi:hypothetical protein|nr:hypothetical protein [Oscillospiraceae bacterium]
MSRTSLKEIAKRAALIKANPKLRHKPNKKDLSVASEHTKLMAHRQYQTIKEDKE